MTIVDLFFPTVTVTQNEVYHPPLSQGAFEYGGSFGQGTDTPLVAATAKPTPVGSRGGAVADSPRLERGTLCLEGKQNGAQALILLGFYRVFLMKSRVRRGAPRGLKLCGGPEMV